MEDVHYFGGGCCVMDERWVVERNGLWKRLAWIHTVVQLSAFGLGREAPIAEAKRGGVAMVSLHASYNQVFTLPLLHTLI